MIKHVANNLYRGPRPTSPRDLLGIDKTINLQWGVHEALHEDWYEKQTTTKKTFIPCSDITPPTRAQVLGFLQEVKSANYNVLVHCLHGKDRTGFMVAVYRMQVCGWTYRQAVKEMFDNGFHKIPYIWWLWELKKYERKLV